MDHRTEARQPNSKHTQLSVCYYYTLLAFPRSSELVVVNLAAAMGKTDRRRRASRMCGFLLRGLRINFRHVCAHSHLTRSSSVRRPLPI